MLSVTYKSFILNVIMLSVIMLNIVASSHLFCSSVSDEEKKFDKTKRPGRNVIKLFTSVIYKIL
jgi:hypothetical protein